MDPTRYDNNNNRDSLFEGYYSWFDLVDKPPGDIPRMSKREKGREVNWIWILVSVDPCDDGRD